VVTLQDAIIFTCAARPEGILSSGTWQYPSAYLSNFILSLKLKRLYNNVEHKEACRNNSGV